MTKSSKIKSMHIVQHLKTVLFVTLLAFTTSGVINAKVASGSQNLSPGLHQGEAVFNLLLHTAKTGFSYDDASGSSVVTKGGDEIVHIGKVDDLKNVPRNQTILDELPDIGSPNANWKQNSSVLRRKVREGYEIRDASKHRLNSSPDPTPLRPDRTVGQSFLGAERNLLDNLGVTPK